MAMWKETPTGRREKPGAQKKHVKRPPEEPEDVGVTADRSGEKSSTRSEATQNVYGRPAGAKIRIQVDHGELMYTAN